ncbi:MAG: oligosaccharide flippase family protein [Chloroflexota bacterium]
MRTTTSNPNSATVGTFFLTAAQAIAIITGYGMHVLVARLLGPAAYGTYGIVFNTVGVIVLIVSSSIPNAVSRSVAAYADRADSIKAAGLRLQGALALLVMVIFLVCSEPIAYLLSDPELVPLLQLSALAIPIYALYYLWWGYLGGRHMFVGQASVVGLYSILKMSAVAALGYFYGVWGAVLGLALSPLVPFLVAWRLVPGKGKTTNSGFSYSELLKFAGPFTVIAIILQVLTTLDLFLIKAVGGDEVVVGHYTAASTIARVPYLLFVGLATVMLPAMSRAVADGKPGKEAYLIRQAVRVVVVVIVPAIAIVGAAGGPIVDLLFSPLYSDAAGPLVLLTAGMSLMALFYVVATAEASAGRTVMPIVVSLSSLGIGLYFGPQFVQAHGAMGAALANFTMGSVTSVTSLIAIWLRFREAIPVGTLVRTIVAAVPIALVTTIVGASALSLPVAVALGLVVYPALLVAMGEVKPEDRELAVSLIRRPPSSSHPSPSRAL